MVTKVYFVNFIFIICEKSTNELYPRLFATMPQNCNGSVLYTRVQ